MIVGQAPGRAAQTTMKPWNDISGVNLRRWLGISEEIFYESGLIALVPMDFYYPGKAPHGDLPPRKDFAGLWHPKIIKQMPNLELIILVGSYAQKYYLADKMKRNLTFTVKAYKEYLPEFLPLVHPSPLNFRWRKINPWFEDEVIPEANRLVQKILSK